MKKIRRNIDLIQINLNDSDGQFYFPENVDFRNRKIDNIMILGSLVGGEISPFDGKLLIDNSELSNFYVELVDDKKQVLQQNVNATNFWPYMNSPITVGSIISLKLSSLKYMGSSSIADTCILVYVSYDGEMLECDIPDRTNTIGISIPAGESIRVSDYVDEYFRRIGATIKGIEAQFDNPFYMDIRELSGKVARFVPSFMMDFINGNSSDAKHTQPLLLGDFDIDFKNTFIYPMIPGEVTNINLTFYY